ncbi:ribbon-helix-helix domain-containing protein [Cutibacterium equinum]|uniref:Ribbon-helix-helix domain-containing protein n=1 Tax=Cutibacterium equinum TaxID=3016342 RepID=A0ABY7QXS9_9ACTN|nr:ribbon-helix-helix domain-containing protein [Cutibacterium equinum]WCC79801.1 ribbon-helix-helix domain-containing protein [Cutibacterium equinum]
MTTQIAVRLPDELVRFLDQSVADGIVTSRAEMVSRAVEREMRHQAAVADAAILTTDGPRDDLDELVAWAATNAFLED